MAYISSYNFPMEKHVLVRVIVMVVCCLAMLGSLFVILSYACFKSLRSQARHLLVNLSLMDFGVGLANLTGAAVNFDQYYNDYSASGTVLLGSKLIDESCKVQAVVALFTTFSSVLWTISLAVYMYFLVFQNWRKTRLYLPLCYLLCYGIPLGLTMWLLLTDRLGHAPYNSSGWCGIKIINPSDKWIDFIAATFGYDLWIYLAFFVCFTVYFALALRMNVEFKDAIQLVGAKKFWKKAFEFIDFKLVLIPIAFFLLRMWSCIVTIIFVYAKVDPDSLPKWACQLLIILSGIGDSGQGLANGIIFVFLTKEVRQRFIKMVCMCFCCKKSTAGTNHEETPLLSNGKLTDKVRRADISSNVTPTSSLVISN